MTPFTYLLIEIIMIENIWGLQRATNIIESYSTLSEIIILLLVVLIPVLCSLLIYKLFIYIRGRLHNLTI